MSSGRSFTVYKLSSESELSNIWKKLDVIAHKQYITAARYTLTQDSKISARKDVVYDFDYSNNELPGGGSSAIWYYPKQRLLVTFDLGQSSAFSSVDQKQIYDTAILESFYVQ